MDIINSIISDLKTNFAKDSKLIEKTIPYWIDTGSTLLNLAIREHGIPGGRLVELTGKSSTGKSALCFSLLAKTQQMGGIGILLDTEASVDLEFASTFGLDIDKLILDKPSTVQKIYDRTFLFIEKIREKVPRDAPILICADSCCPATDEEVDKAMEESLKIGDNARIQRRGLRKLVTLLEEQNATFIGINHLVANPMAAWGEPKEVSTGGTAWQFFPHLRIQLKGAQKITGKVKDSCIGIKTKAHVVKSKIGIPFKSAEIIISYNEGIDDIAAMVEFCANNKAFGNKRGWHEWVGHSQAFKKPNGEEKTMWRETELVQMFKENPKEVEELKNLCKTMYNSLEPKEILDEDMQVESEYAMGID